jgi:hypothetical protein
MCKKLFALCVVLVLSSAVFADDVQLNGFESGTVEGWTTNNASDSLVPGATLGVTEGTMSMKIQGSGMTWWDEAAMIDVGTIEGGLDAMRNANKFELDISVFQAEWTMDTGVGWTTSPSVGLLLNPGSGQWWELPAISIGEPAAKYGNPGADITLHVAWDYQAYKNIMGDLKGVCKFILKFVAYGYNPGGSYYIDNVMLTGTPEPATMALLGLGSLVLLRRRK